MEVLEEKDDSFLAVTVGLSQIEAALWQLKAGEVKILGVGSQEFEKEEEIAEAAGGAIDEAMGDSEAEPKKVFFGIPHHWSDKGVIKKEKQKKLKLLARELELEPVAFVLTCEAILHFLSQEESAPISAVLVEVGKKGLEVLIARAGKIFGAQKVSLKESVGQTLEKTLLSLFSGRALPARIFLFGENDLEKVKGELLSFSWDGSLFLHLPKPEVLEKNIAATAVALASSKNLGRLEEEEKTTFGFVIGRDIVQRAREGEKTKPAPPTPSVPTPPPPPSAPRPFAQLPSWCFSKIPKVDFVFLSQLPIKPILILLTILITLGGLLLIAYWFLPQAKVVIFVEPKVLEKDLTFLVALDVSQASEGVQVIPAEKLTTEVKGSLAAAATGKKLVGEHAKGKVEIFNKTLAQKTFPSGTVLVGPNQLKFSFLAPVTVEAATIATTSGGETKTYGRADADVTAQDIGTQYNLPADTHFAFQDFSTSLYQAFGKEALTGGSSQEVTVVSVEDLTRVEASLSADLKKKAKDALAGKATSDQKFLEEAIELEVKSQSFDKEAGEEAKEVNLTMVGQASVLAYSPKKLDDLLGKLISETVPPEFELVTEKLETQESFVTKKENGFVLSVHFKANLLPKFDFRRIQTDLAGKTPNVARDYLDHLAGSVGSQISIRPPLPAKFLILPHASQRIKIEVKEK